MRITRILFSFIQYFHFCHNYIINSASVAHCDKRLQNLSFCRNGIQIKAQIEPIRELYRKLHEIRTVIFLSF